MTERDEKPEKKGILSWISDALYEKVESGEDEGEGAAAAREPRRAAAGAPRPEAAEERPLESPADLATRLRDQISARGPAFTQFLALVASFADIIPDEAGRYRAALTALEKTGGLTAEQVLTAGKDQLQALETQRGALAEVLSRKRQALRESGGGVDAIRARIAGLQQEIGALQEQERAILRETAAEETRIKAAEEGFVTILGTMQDEITAAREKIKKHLG